MEDKRNHPKIGLHCPVFLQTKTADENTSAVPLEATASSFYFVAASVKTGTICFLRETTPGSVANPF